MNLLPVWAIILLCLGAVAIVGTIIYVIVNCTTQEFEVDEEEEDDKTITGVTEEYDEVETKDFEFKGHEKIVKNGIILDGNVTWSVHDDLGKHRKETQRIVEEHSTYRVLAVATTVGIIFVIISAVAIIFICLNHRNKKANSNKPPKQKKTPIEQTNVSSFEDVVTAVNQCRGKDDPTFKGKKMRVTAQIHHPAPSQNHHPAPSSATAHRMRPEFQLNKNLPNKFTSELDLIKACSSKKTPPKMQKSSIDNLSVLMEMGFNPKLCLHVLKSMPNVETAANYLMELADSPHPSTGQSRGSNLSQEDTEADENSGVESYDEE